MKQVPIWAWAIAGCGVAALVSAGVLGDSYARDLVLQLGTAALLLVPILLAERSIGVRLTRQLDDLALVRRAESALDLDEIWKDFGQKLGGQVSREPLERLENLLAEHGWTCNHTVDGYRIWRDGEQGLALPDGPEDVIAAPHVRAVLRALDMTPEDYVEWSRRAE